MICAFAPAERACTNLESPIGSVKNILIFGSSRRVPVDSSQEIMSGKVRQRNAADSATHSVNEKILKECHTLYIDPEHGITYSLH